MKFITTLDPKNSYTFQYKDVAVRKKNTNGDYEYKCVTCIKKETNEAVTFDGFVKVEKRQNHSEAVYEDQEFFKYCADCKKVINFEYTYAMTNSYDIKVLAGKLEKKFEVSESLAYKKFKKLESIMKDLDEEYGVEGIKKLEEVFLVTFNNFLLAFTA